MSDVALFIGYFVIMLIVFGSIATLIAYVVSKIKKVSRKKTPITEESVRYVTPPRSSVESSPETRETAKRIVEESIKRQQEEAKKIDWIKSIDRLELIACVAAAKECIPKVINALEGDKGGKRIAKNLRRNAELCIYEFVLLCSAYNNLFSDKDGRGHFANSVSILYDFRNGYYRLCKLAYSLIFQKENATNADVDKLIQKIKFYKDELRFMRQSTFALPIHLLYPLLYPQKELDYNKQVQEVDPITCIALWSIIAEHLALDLPSYNEKHQSHTPSHQGL